MYYEELWVEYLKEIKNKTFKMDRYGGTFFKVMMSCDQSNADWFDSFMTLLKADIVDYPVLKKEEKGKDTIYEMIFFSLIDDYEVKKLINLMPHFLDYEASGLLDNLMEYDDEDEDEDDKD